jgi:hypothetical protein
VIAAVVVGAPNEQLSLSYIKARITQFAKCPLSGGEPPPLGTVLVKRTIEATRYDWDRFQNRYCYPSRSLASGPKPPFRTSRGKECPLLAQSGHRLVHCKCPLRRDPLILAPATAIGRSPQDGQKDRPHRFERIEIHFAAVHESAIGT